MQISAPAFCSIRLELLGDVIDEAPTITFRHDLVVLANTIEQAVCPRDGGQIFLRRAVLASKEPKGLVQQRLLAIDRFDLVLGSDLLGSRNLGALGSRSDGTSKGGSFHVNLLGSRWKASLASKPRITYPSPDVKRIFSYFHLGVNPWIPGHPQELAGLGILDLLSA